MTGLLAAANTLALTPLTPAEHFAGWALIAIGVAIWILWPIVAINNWQNVIESHARLGYLIGDMVLVAPLCFASGYGAVEELQWGQPMLLLAVGAAAYDLTHFLIFLAQIGVPKIKGKSLPIAVYPVAIVLVLVFLAWLAWRVIRLLISPPAGPLVAFEPLGSGLYVGLAGIVGGALLCGVVAWRQARCASGAASGSSPGREP